MCLQGDDTSPSMAQYVIVAVDDCARWCWAVSVMMVPMINGSSTLIEKDYNDDVACVLFKKNL